MGFKVEAIVNQNTITVSPRWTWEGYAGDSVKIKNFNITGDEQVSFIVNKLNKLLVNNEVELKNPSNPLKKDGNDEITVSVYLNGVDISVYFPELKSVA